jgi:magnesium transporter
MGDAWTRVYRAGVLEAENFPVADVSDYLDQPDTVVWVDFCNPSEQQFKELADELGVHELAIEDVLEPQQRPKLDYYGTHKFLVCHAVEVDPKTGRLDETEIDAFISPRWLVTIREGEQFSIDPVVRRWDRSSEMAVHGVHFLLYGLLDVIVDDYFDAVGGFDDFYEEVAEGIFTEHPLDPSQQHDWFHMRRALVRFHRLVVPLREVISALMRHEQTTVSTELYPYFQDVYDHILRVSESTDSLRDLVSTIVETNLSLRDFRQNQVMKKITSWAAIIAVPTLITGFYGMNVPYPGFGQPSGFIASVVVTIIMSGGLYLLFRRSDWL